MKEAVKPAKEAGENGTARVGVGKEGSWVLAAA